MAQTHPLREAWQHERGRVVIAASVFLRSFYFRYFLFIYIEYYDMMDTRIHGRELFI